MKKLYYLKTKTGTYNAIGNFGKKGFIVLKGSTCTLNVAASAEKFRHVSERRGILEKQGILKKEDKHYIFLKDYEFSSSSSAANIISGRTCNGNTVWKTQTGKTLGDDIKNDYQ